MILTEFLTIFIINFYLLLAPLLVRTTLACNNSSRWSDFENKEVVQGLAQSEVKEADGPVFRAPELFDEFFIAAGVPCCIIVLSG